jgi:elongator complex protein 1
MNLLIPTSRPQTVPPLLGVSRSGMLSWGSAVIAPADVTSVVVRARGPGGPMLLYTTRKNLLYTVLMSQLSAYTHRELTADPQSLRTYKCEE